MSTIDHKAETLTSDEKAKNEREIARGLRLLQDWSSSINKAHGWDDEVLNVGESIALVHSEASEALEAYRDKKLSEAEGYELKDLMFQEVDDGGVWSEQVTEEDQALFERDEKANGVENPARLPLRKPVGFMSELADIVIRVAHLAERVGGDLAKAVIEKEKYNETRPFRHGGKAC